MTFLNVIEIELALVALNTTYPSITRLIPLPNTTVEGRTSNALLIRATRASIAGRRSSSSAASTRASGAGRTSWSTSRPICSRYTRTGAGLAYGSKTCSAAMVRAIVERTDVIVFPDQNPDGRAYSMAAAPGTSQALWRKNRNPASSGGVASKIGVDINRNYDFLWDFPVKFAPSVVPASTNPAVRDLPRHGPVLRSGDSQRAVAGRPVRECPLLRRCPLLYRAGPPSVGRRPEPDHDVIDVVHEHRLGRATRHQRRRVSGFLPPVRLAELQTAGAVIRDAIQAVRGQGYTLQQGFALYPTSGTSEDWAFTREFFGRPKLSGFVIEFNKSFTFFPTWPRWST